MFILFCLIIYLHLYLSWSLFYPILPTYPVYPVYPIYPIYPIHHNPSIHLSIYLYTYISMYIYIYTHELYASFLFKAMTSQRHFPTVPSSENSSAQEVKEEKKAKVKEEDEKTLASTEDGMDGCIVKKRQDGGMVKTPWFKWFLNDVPHSNEEFYSCQLCFRCISGKTWDWSSKTPRKWAVRNRSTQRNGARRHWRLRRQSCRIFYLVHESCDEGLIVQFLRFRWVVYNLCFTAKLP